MGKFLAFVRLHTGGDVDDAATGGRTHSRQQLQDPLEREIVFGILSEPQDGDQVLDVGGLLKFDTAVYHVGNISAPELQLQVSQVKYGAAEHGHVAEDMG